MSLSEFPPEYGPAEGCQTPTPKAPDNSLILPRWAPFTFYLVLATLFLWRSSFTSTVFLPAGLLDYIAPWKALSHSGAPPPWNPLRWDGIAQFYPWRLFAARTVHSGFLPLWNPYQFCGTPFTANSQSAPFYPGNILFYLLPTARAFGYSALTHLTLCGWFTYLFLRRLKCSEFAALLGGTVFAYSSWQVNWLQLPTFLATSCWIPLAMGQALAAVRSSSIRPKRIATLGLPIGMMLLAGHLQIAFYGLLVCSLWIVALLCDFWRTAGGVKALQRLGVCIAALAVGVGLGAPQLLPSVELSHLSHRVGKPTMGGYTAYVDYALPLAGLVQIGLPDFFGGDTDPSNPYWGFYLHQVGVSAGIVRHNAAETAMYVGIIPVMLCIAATVLGAERPRQHRATLFFVVLAFLALLMALGAPVDALFYFNIPGFSQSGSPARALVIWSFACSALAAFGLDAMLKRLSGRQLTAVLTIYIGLLAVGISAAAIYIEGDVSGFKELGVPMLGDAMARIAEDWLRLALFFTVGFLLFLPAVQNALQRVRLFARTSHSRANLVGFAAVLLVAADLFIAGIRINPVSPSNEVYPETAGIKYLEVHAGHERIYPINMYWSLNRAPHVVLPPNSATVYGLRDFQGYDSLLTGDYKKWADGFSLPDTRIATLNRRDSAPVEVANMIFFQDPNLPAVAGSSAAFALTPAADDKWNPSPAQTPRSQKLDVADDGMDLFAIPRSTPRAQMVTETGTPVGQVKWIEDGATRVVVSTTSNTAAALNLNDQIYPGWKATVDGAAAHISWQPALHIFRNVAVPAGNHTVEFKYDPASFRLGLYLSLLAYGALIAMLLANAFGEIPPASSEPDHAL